MDIGNLGLHLLEALDRDELEVEIGQDSESAASGEMVIQTALEFHECGLALVFLSAQDEMYMVVHELVGDQPYLKEGGRYGKGVHRGCEIRAVRENYLLVVPVCGQMPERDVAPKRRLPTSHRLTPGQRSVNI